MATDKTRIEEILDLAYGAQPEPPKYAPGDLGRASVEAFVAARSDARELRSAGQLRLSGAGVLGHAAELDDVGQLASLWQRCVTAVGAALEGSQSAFGRLANDVVERTQLMLDASPAPGSLVLNVQPKASPVGEAYPGGKKSLLGDDPRPLADRASEALLQLLQHASQPSLDELDNLTAEFQSLGPRVATSVKMLADTIVKAHVDMDAEWREPQVATLRASLSSASAGWVSEFVGGRDLDVEDLVLRGTVRTVSDIAKWSVEGSSGLEQVDANELPADVVRSTNVGDRVEVVVQVRQTQRPDGTTRRALTARTLRLLGDTETLTVIPSVE